jgi:hypothetical protein
MEFSDFARYWAAFAWTTDDYLQRLSESASMRLTEPVHAAYLAGAADGPRAFTADSLRRARRALLRPMLRALVSVCHSQEPARLARALQGGFEVLFVPGSRDDAGRFMGGTEMRVLTTHAGKLYAGNGYWEDQPGPEGLQGAEILVLHSRGGALAGRSLLRRAVARWAPPRLGGLGPR